MELMGDPAWGFDCMVGASPGVNPDVGTGAEAEGGTWAGAGCKPVDEAGVEEGPGGGVKVVDGCCCWPLPAGIKAAGIKAAGIKTAGRAAMGSAASESVATTAVLHRRRGRMGRRSRTS